LPFDFEQFDREGFDRIMGDSRSAHKHLYDGGLRDTTPIRTAMRLGARDILVITGDRLQAVNWRYKSPGALDPAGDLDIAAIPLAQYFLGLLNMWNNDVARTDMLLALAQNEFIGWLYRCFSMIEGDKRSELIEQFNEYWQVHGRRLFRELGGSTWLGGRQGFFTSRDHGITPAEAAARVYGVPFHDEGCRIRYIAPEREIVDARAFDDFTGIEEAMLLGERAADHPVELSYPVPDDLIGEH
jgi:hypothetical protein